LRISRRLRARVRGSRWREYGVHLYTVTAFEWDPRKATSNARKHGIRFADAILVLEDDRALTVRDEAYGEERWVTIGMDAMARVLVVVYTWRDGSTLRIVSARPATRKEHQLYVENP
jgi:uncharacterized DUF497 family protein